MYLTEIKNEISNLTDLVTTSALNAKVTETEKKI